MILISSVAAVAGQSNIGVGLALVMGLAKLFAGGLSMGVGDWLATDAELQLAKSERAREAWEFDNYPEGRCHFDTLMMWCHYDVMIICTFMRN